jgi:hypothetical protein
MGERSAGRPVTADAVRLAVAIVDDRFGDRLAIHVD